MENITVQEWYSVLKDLATAGLTLAGLIIAGKGLTTWRRQIKGGKEFDTAYNLHYSVLKLRDAIRHVRNPAIWPSESARAIKFAREKYPEKTEEELSKDTAYVYEMRWEKISAALTEIESHLLSAEVLWGPNLLALIRPLNRKVTELNIILKQYFQPEIRTNNLMHIRDKMYDKSNETGEDEFSTEINEIIRPIAEYLQAKLK